MHPLILEPLRYFFVYGLILNLMTTLKCKKVKQVHLDKYLLKTKLITLDLIDLNQTRPMNHLYRFIFAYQISYIAIYNEYDIP